MKAYEVVYRATWRDNFKKHSHNNMMLDFICFSNSESEALASVIKSNPDLDPKKFEVYDAYEIK